MKPETYLILFFVVIALIIGFEATRTPDEALYKFNELGDITLRIKDGTGTVTINEIGTFYLEVSSNELIKMIEITTNSTTEGYPGILPIDFSGLTSVAVEIEWKETGMIQEVLL